MAIENILEKNTKDVEVPRSSRGRGLELII